ncbi:MAG: MjaI family restriction endonuclease [Natronomonas sp.]|uniref:MjaI family restriction endonuclease n=1 Tax=Natronomonas sp. TaxID=2184060 RepID=UPI00286FDC05|nr:MjaI family restriction endonuclease [Natronomonas sp.]MDR9429988.1 MjaI family restriction endonuclease [Natronomonas sp.]
MSRTIRLSEDEREELVADIDPEFPKYTTQIMNTANQNSQGTRPATVGQLNEIIEEYKEQYRDGDFEDWRQFYFENYDGDENIEEATDKVFDMVVKMREAAEEIDREMVNRWVKDLVLYKTYTGLGRNEEAVLKKLSEEYDLPYELGTAEDESKGIDGYLGSQPVSVKPITYKQKARLQEDIDAPIVYYEDYSTTNALKLHLDELDEVLR